MHRCQIRKSPARWRGFGIDSKKPSGRLGFFVSSLITRKIDMMGLIYGQSATGSSGVYKDLLLIEDLGGVDDCGLFDLFEALVDAASPVTTGALW